MALLAEIGFRLSSGIARSPSFSSYVRGYNGTGYARWRVAVARAHSSPPLWGQVQGNLPPPG
jgi:hypothetical protein